LFFGRVTGNNWFGTQASATATFLPRDIVVVTDLSGSMCHDSSIKREATFPINIQDIWVALGSPTHGTMTDFNTLQYIDDNTSNVLASLGLDIAPYPYPEGSWSEYVNYVQTRSHILSEGYQHRYGLKTWVDYLLIQRRYKSSTPDLSDTPEQPMTAVKGAVSEMMTYLAGLQSQDKVALTSYDSDSYVEQALTTDTGLVTSRMNYLQAGAWGAGTNIGAGIEQGATTVTGAGSRADARKVMLVLTDGLANASSNALSPADYARDRAQWAADQGITIHTVSFTDSADQVLMQEIADIGSGVHYHVTGYTPAEYTEALEDVFVAIAAMLPLGLTN
jgi:Mg-chelatase subunit ChlD